MATASVTRLGSRLARFSRYGALRSWMVGVATLLVGLSCLSMALTVATYAGWDGRSYARAVRQATLYPDEQPQFYWSSQTVLTPEAAEVSVVYVSPLRSSAPLPPGLERWPFEGEIVVSPAMRTPEMENLSARYGTVSGTIEPEGLMDPGERLVYVRPAEGSLTPENSVVGTGFGTRKASTLGAIVNRQPLSTFLGVEVVFMVAPALFALMASVRVGAGNRSRRAEILKRLGASRVQIWLIQWGETRVPMGLGLGIALAVCGLFLGLDVRLPWIGNVVQARDARDGWWMLLACLAVASLIVLVTATGRWANRSENASLGLARRSWRFAGWASPVVGVLTIIGTNVLIGLSALTVTTPVFLAGSVATIALLPSSITRWLTVISRRLRGFALETGSASRLIGAAQVAAKPRPSARFAATAAAGLVLVTLACDMTNMTNEEADRALAAQASLDDAVARIRVPAGASAEVRASVTEILANDFAIVGTHVDETTGREIVRGSADSLARLGLADGVEGEPNWVSLVIGTEVEVEAGGLDSVGAETFVVAAWHEDKVDTQSLSDWLASVTVPAWCVVRTGDGWVAGMVIAQIQNRWLEFFGLIGIAILLVGLWAGYGNELVRAGRSVAPIQMLAPRPTFAASVLLWRVVAPIAVSVVPAIGLGLGLCLVLESSRLGGGIGTLPYGFVLAGSMIVVLSGVVAWLAISASTVRNAHRFQVGNPDE